MVCVYLIMLIFVIERSVVVDLKMYFVRSNSLQFCRADFVKDWAFDQITGWLPEIRVELQHGVKYFQKSFVGEDIFIFILNLGITAFGMV